MKKPVGVIGSGSFGMTICKLLLQNVDVLLFSRRQEVIDAINNQGSYYGVDTSKGIKAISDLSLLAASCDVIIPVIPSAAFRNMANALAPFVDPHHVLIHATKGLDVRKIPSERFEKGDFTRKEVYSMSEVIMDETSVIRIGCISGPNLAREILDGQPATSVIASEFEEVIHIGQDILGSKHFTVFGSYELKGAELAGAFKNIIAIGSGILSGLNLGKNMQAALITRGLREMIQFGQAMGANGRSFLGTAGIGDLIATATSDNSRNYTFGKRLAQGESRTSILASSTEVIEGVSTLKIIHLLAQKEKLQLPITTMLYRVVYEDYEIEKAIKLLMTYNFAQDVDFI